MKCFDLRLTLYQKMNKFLTLISKNSYLCDIIMSSYYLTARLNFARREMPQCEKIHNFPLIWQTFSLIRESENDTKSAMFVELVDESGLNKKHSPQNILERIIAVNTSINQLKKLNLIQSFSTIEESLLSQLEPFPFDRTKMLLSNESENDFSIIQIRDAIEKQYLAWKFKVGLNTINDIFSKYKLCFFKYRSVGALSRNIAAIETHPETSNLSVVEKVYHLNQKPFDIKSVASFQPTVAGLNWQVLPEICPKIFIHSHQYIVFVVSLLKVNKGNLDFTEIQIQKGLPFLYLTFHCFTTRLNNILSIKAVSKHRNDENFLLLLSYGLLKLKMLVKEGAEYRNLTMSVADRLRSSRKHILDILSEFISAEPQTKSLVLKYSKDFMVSPFQIRETLGFLKRLNFSDAEMSESIKIIFYPRSEIERALIKVESEAENLKKIGFHKGCVEKRTNFFKCGTKEPNKLLQLCLYYLEIERIAEKRNHAEKTDFIFFNYEIIPD